jgi:hypothetical protein
MGIVWACFAIYDKSKEAITMGVVSRSAAKGNGSHSSGPHMEARHELLANLPQCIQVARPTSRICRDVALRQAHVRVAEEGKRQDFEVFRLE